MKSENSKEMLLVAGVTLAFSALFFLIGFTVGSKKKKRMAINSNGELVKEEVPEEI